MAASSYKTGSSVPEYKGFGRAVVWKGNTDDLKKDSSGSSNQTNYGFGVMIIGKLYNIDVNANR
jgi:hypothetical protein